MHYTTAIHGICCSSRGVALICVPRVTRRSRTPTRPSSSLQRRDVSLGLFRRQGSVSSTPRCNADTALLYRSMATLASTLVVLFSSAAIAAEPTQGGSEGPVMTLGSSKDRAPSSSMVESKKNCQSTSDEERERRTRLSKENLERTQSLVRDMWQSLE